MAHNNISAEKLINLYIKEHYKQLISLFLPKNIK